MCEHACWYVCSKSVRSYNRAPFCALLCCDHRQQTPPAYTAHTHAWRVRSGACLCALETVCLCCLGVSLQRQAVGCNYPFNTISQVGPVLGCLMRVAGPVPRFEDWKILHTRLLPLCWELRQWTP